MVGMRDSYRSFQAEKVGQNALKLGLRELESLHHWYCKKDESRTNTKNTKNETNPTSRRFFFNLVFTNLSGESESL